MQKQLSTHRGRGGYLEALLNGCPDAIIAIDAEGIITFANQEACRLTGRDMRELVGANIVIVYESPEAAREANRKLYMSGGVIHNHESKAKTKDGKVVPVRISASHLKDSSGNYVGAVGYFQTYRPWTETERRAKEYVEELEVRLEECRDLDAPIFELYPELAMVEVIGRLDCDRFQGISKKILDYLKITRSRVVLVDLSAALVSDERVSGELIKIVRTLQLLGAKCILAGVQPSVAQAMEPLAGDVNSIMSFSSVKRAFEAALDILGFEIWKKNQTNFRV